MILIVSDIHLADTPERETVDVDSLCKAIAAEAARAAKGGYTFKLLLLGDIFEILKSQVWRDRNLRPWESCTDDHVEAVTKIFAKIVEVNAAFFNTLKALSSADKCEVVYVPGNHDWPLNHDRMGAPARKLFGEKAGLKRAGDRPFPVTFSDEDHSLLASHGHEHDSANATIPDTVALGDAIVIEVLLVLPDLVAKGLGYQATDARLKFLHELDNVRPQSIGAMVSWLLLGLRQLADEKAQEVTGKAIGQIVETLRKLRRRTDASPAWNNSSLWIDLLVRTGEVLVKRTDVLPFLAGLGGEAGDSYADFGHLDLSRAFTTDDRPPFRHVAHGHTHLPEHHGLALDWNDGKPAIYLNTGTWRRVHRLGRRTDGAPYFAEFKEETCVLLYCRGERDSAGRVTAGPSYEFRRMVRG